MKKGLISLFLMALLVCLPTVVFGTDFRNVNWGMSPDDVKTHEDAPESRLILKQKPPTAILAFDVQLLNRKVNLRYNFNEHGLFAAQYTAAFGQVKVEKTFDWYLELKAALIEKYGAPAKDDEIWVNETYKAMPTSTLDHITRGHVAFTAIWIIDRTAIVLECKQLKALGITCPQTTLQYCDKNYCLQMPQPKPNQDLKNL